MFESLRRLVARHRGGRLTTYRDRYRIAALLSLLPLSVSRIISLFGSDKQRPGEHAYGPTYQSILAPFRYRPVRILEIGILNGESLLAWRCFFPFGTTIGIDIEAKPGMAG